MYKRTCLKWFGSALCMSEAIHTYKHTRRSFRATNPILMDSDIIKLFAGEILARKTSILLDGFIYLFPARTLIRNEPNTNLDQRLRKMTKSDIVDYI